MSVCSPYDTAAIAEPLSAAPSGLQPPQAISDVGAADDWAAIIAETHAGTDAETIAELPATVEVTSVEAPPVERPHSETESHATPHEGDDEPPNLVSTT